MEIEGIDQFLAEVAAESIGWIPLGDEAYLHVADESDEEITIVGIPDASMVGMNVLLVG